MSENLGLIEALHRVREIVLNNYPNNVSDTDLISAYNGEVKRRKIIKVKKAKKKDNIEVEPWRIRPFTKLYLKCKNTNKLYDATTEELVGQYIFDPDSEIEKIDLFK